MGWVKSFSSPWVILFYQH